MLKTTKNNSMDEIIQVLEYLNYDGTIKFINIDPKEISELCLAE
ncbi:MAG: hypothetical protein ACFE9L_08480 [Candidatus Hodarchaeota archaeon]